MEEQLISFNTAELAKEKGFNLGQSKAYYNHGETELLLWVWSEDHNDQKDLLAYAPTQSLLQRWLREVHNIEFDIIVTKIGENKKSYDIFIVDTSKVEVKQNKKVIYSFFNFKSYEEVLELGLEQALKLIK